MANNALSRVPDVDDFLAGFTLLLNAEGVATFAWPNGPSPQAACASSTSSHSAWQCEPRAGRTLAKGRPVFH